MNYTLMHKTIPVMDIEIDESTGNIIKVGEIFHKEHLPLSISMHTKEIDRTILNKWWLGRSIPVSRSGIRTALDMLEIAMPQLLIEKCLGLSLSDQYWICPATKEIKWQDINFFENNFSEDVGNVLFDKKEKVQSFDFMSPDNTSDGWLKKKWKIVNKKRYLIKGGSGQAQQEPFNEVLATQIMEKIDTISFIPYSLIWENNMPFSVCENFITKNTELVSAWSIMQAYKKANHISVYEHFLNCCEKLGIPNYQDSLNKMLTIDYLIVNSDRHFNNFGAVRNADTLEWLGLAPIFDCGTSMWCDQPTSCIQLTDKAMLSKPFKPSHSEQIKLVTDFKWLNFNKLDGVLEEYDKLLKVTPYIDEYRRNKLCSALQNRLESLYEIINIWR